MEFMNWSLLADFGGAVIAVLTITEFVKEIPFLNKIPTRILSFFIALAVLYSAYYFTGLLTASSALLIPVNAVTVSLATNGGFDAIRDTSKKALSLIKADKNQP